MPLTDPVPSSSFDVLERNIQDTDKFVNQETGTFINRVGKEIKPIPVIEAEANAAVISLGWHQVGLFADGFTYTLQNDIAKDADGDWYRWNGLLPKVVTAGTLPSSDANFVKIDYKSHAELSDRNPADGSAHNADDVAKYGGGSVQDFIDAQYTTVTELATGKYQVDTYVRLLDRAEELFKLNSGGTPNGIDILDAGNGNTAVISDLLGIKSARAFGAKLDWNGTTGTDETAIFQRLHDLGVNYAMDGKFSKITGTLPIKSNQKVYFLGGGFHKTNSGYIYSTNNQSVDNFIGYNGYFTGNLQADLIDMSGAAGGYPSSTKNCKLIDCNANQMYVLFNMSNARACQIVRGRYAGHTALQFTDKSAECLIESALLIKDEGHSTAGTKGIHAFKGTISGSYPEGLTVKDCLIFRFERNLHIEDLFIGKIHSNYIDSGDDCQSSIMSYDVKTEGVDITNNWFFQRGLVIGKTGETSPRQFRSNISGNHFNAMVAGTDIELARWSHGVTIANNHHNSTQTGTHICVVAQGNNNGIIIDTLNPIGYTQYVQMKASGELNTISNIPNVDGLAYPISLAYPVNVWNVEGFNEIKEGTFAAGTFAAGAVVASADNCTLSAGVAHLSFDISRITAAGDGFLRVAAYTAGTFDLDPNIAIAGVSGFNAYSAGDKSIRFSFPFAVKKATKTTFAVIVEAGSATITGGVGVTDGIVVMQ